MTNRISLFKRWRTEDILQMVFYLILMIVFSFFFAAFGWWVISLLIGFEFSWNWAAAFFVFTTFCGSSNGLKLTFSE